MLRSCFVLALALATACPLTATAKGCPPGLAKKHNGCQPPGQARGGEMGFVQRNAPTTWRQEPERDVIVIRRGDPLDGYRHERLYDDRRYALPPLRPGERYEVIDGQVVRVDEQTATILGLMGLVDDLLQ